MLPNSVRRNSTRILFVPESSAYLFSLPVRESIAKTMSVVRTLQSAELQMRNVRRIPRFTCTFDWNGCSRLTAFIHSFVTSSVLCNSKTNPGIVGGAHFLNFIALMIPKLSLPQIPHASLLLMSTSSHLCRNLAAEIYRELGSKRALLTSLPHLRSSVPCPHQLGTHNWTGKSKHHVEQVHLAMRPLNRRGLPLLSCWWKLLQPSPPVFLLVPQQLALHFLLQSTLALASSEHACPRTPSFCPHRPFRLLPMILYHSSYVWCTRFHSSGKKRTCSPTWCVSKLRSVSSEHAKLRTD